MAGLGGLVDEEDEGNEKKPKPAYSWNIPFYRFALRVLICAHCFRPSKCDFLDLYLHFKGWVFKGTASDALRRISMGGVCLCLCGKDNGQRSSDFTKISHHATLTT